MRNSLLSFLLATSLLFTFTACEDDNGIPEDVLKVNKFVHENMSNYYLWNTEMPNIDHSSQPDSKDYFERLLNKPTDQWSFITDDYPGLVAYFSGVRKSNGYTLRPYYLNEDNTQVVAFIEYIEPNSPASKANLQRGDMIYKINDIVLTSDNYNQIAYLDESKLTLGIINSEGGVDEILPTLNISTTVLETNPIHIHNVIEHGGKKVGYLMYKSFIADFDQELEDVFSEFKSQNIDELVLDLRYNGGGSVSTALLICSMIAPANMKGEVLLNSSYNSILTDAINRENNNDPEFFINRFHETNVNLDLERLVVLTTYKTASASEMVMYALSPYIDVYQIGETTHGKYFASITIDDEKEHNWAIQPIIMRSENSDNSIDYTSGLLPDVELFDFIGVSNYYPLGDKREHFLAKALEHLTGVSPNGAALKTSQDRIALPLNAAAKSDHPLQFDMQYKLK